MNTKPAAGAKPEAWTDPDDAPELTEDFFAKAETFQGDTFVKRGRGRPPTGNAKELVSLRLDRDVLVKLREAGPGWQSQVSGLLRLALENPKLAHGLQTVADDLEGTYRRANSAEFKEVVAAIEGPHPGSGRYVEPRAGKAAKKAG